jgi:Flp pilus assembly pilin Flp
MFQTLKTHLTDFAADETAPTTLEYAIIATALTGIVIGAVTFLMGRIAAAFQNAGNQLH